MQDDIDGESLIPFSQSKILGCLLGIFLESADPAFDLSDDIAYSLKIG